MMMKMTTTRMITSMTMKMRKTLMMKVAMMKILRKM